jgi:hypothetical protein
VTAVYSFIAEEKADAASPWSVAEMCRVLAVSRSGFYDWEARQPSQRDVGPYDLVAISEFADDETATAFALAVSSQGNVRTTSMRAFDAGEMRAIIEKLG